MKHRIIFETDDKVYRILEVMDNYYNMADLKGDCFNPEVNPDKDAEALKQEERDFEDLVNREGVYGYILEKWHPEAGRGYEHIDSCWDFVGQYTKGSESFEHYIVYEFQNLIRRSA